MLFHICKPKQKEVPRNDIHFYWEFALPTVTPVAKPMLPVQLQTANHTILEFVHSIPKVVSETVHNNITSIMNHIWLYFFKLH